MHVLYDKHNKIKRLEFVMRTAWYEFLTFIRCFSWFPTSKSLSKNFKVRDVMFYLQVQSVPRGKHSTSRL